VAQSPPLLWGQAPHAQQWHLACEKEMMRHRVHPCPALLFTMCGSRCRSPAVAPAPAVGACRSDVPQCCCAQWPWRSTATCGRTVAAPLGPVVNATSVLQVAQSSHSRRGSRQQGGGGVPTGCKRPQLPRRLAQLNGRHPVLLRPEPHLLATARGGTGQAAGQAHARSRAADGVDAVGSPHSPVGRRHGAAEAVEERGQGGGCGLDEAGGIEHTLGTVKEFR
jgi:hypothetical protein